jgi:hypothetical protein
MKNVTSLIEDVEEVMKYVNLINHMEEVKALERNSGLFHKRQRFCKLMTIIQVIYFYFLLLFLDNNSSYLNERKHMIFFILQKVKYFPVLSIFLPFLKAIDIINRERKVCINRAHLSIVIMPQKTSH